eukprot:2829421-Prymnesium_polylepis.1
MTIHGLSAALNRLVDSFEEEAIDEERAVKSDPQQHVVNSAMLRRPFAPKNVPSREAITSSLRDYAGSSPTRLTPRQRKVAEKRVADLEINAWLQRRAPAAIRDSSVSTARRQALQECFDMLDADHSGSIDYSELSVAMKCPSFVWPPPRRKQLHAPAELLSALPVAQALGFHSDSIRRAILLGDKNGDGE